MADFKLELPKEIPANARAELVRALEASARVETSAAQMRDFDATQTLYVIAATAATVDIIWKWYQAARAKNKGKRYDVMIMMPDGKQVSLARTTWDELKNLVG